MQLIVAVDQRNAIGHHDGKLPWRSPTDMNRFKDLTRNTLDPMQAPSVVMGRKTFDSIGRCLPGRTNFVLTRSTDEAIRLMNLKAIPVMHEEPWELLPKHAWVIGGAEIYRQALEADAIDMIYLTKVHLASGAPVTLGFELYNEQAFVNAERAKGREWTSKYLIRPNLSLEEPLIDFLIIERNRT